jgi:hypothetical protein
MPSLSRTPLATTLVVQVSESTGRRPYGRWDEEFGFVEAVEGLAIEGDHADAELGLIECGVGEDGGDAAGERTFGERGVGGGAGGRVMRRRRVRWGLGGKSDNSDCGRENG